LTPRRPEGDAQQPILRPGLYFLNACHVQPGLAYIIFWPEDTTWDDSASSLVSRNRATFIRHVQTTSESAYHSCSRRFLTKLCDQVVALISDEHSSQLVFRDDENASSTDSDTDTEDDSDRLFDFEVKQTGQQGETAVAAEGFKVWFLLRSISTFLNTLQIHHACIAGISALPPSCPEAFDMERLQPKVIVGDMSQAIMNSEYIPEQSKTQPIPELGYLTFRDILKYVMLFPKS
jgi:hypothetical protein